MKKITLLVAGILLIASYAFAAPIDGRWTGTFKLDMGDGNPMDIPLGFDFKADGAKLTGTADGMSGPITIKNGKIDGNNISYEYSFDFNGMDMTLKYKGVLKGDKLDVTWTTDMGGGGMGGPGGGAPPAKATLTHQ